MGSGGWDPGVYATASATRAATGKSAFDYSATTRSRGVSAWKAHENLDPAGLTVRESRDSDEHPNSTAIAVLFDVTGSMGRIPVTLQEKLPDLFGLLLRKGYVEDPQVLIGAIGDATCDRVPLQIGQFESDNRVDDNVGAIFLEGGGGGQNTESYELGMYAMARHTAIDCWEKRGKKPYLFMIGDEHAYSKVKAREVNELFGVADPETGLKSTVLAEDIPLADIVEELKSKFEVYFIIPAGSSYAGQTQLEDFWHGLFEQNVILLEDPAAVSEIIALTVGLAEGTVDLDEGLDDLAEIGSTAGDTVGKALAHVAAGVGGSLAVSDAPADLDAADDDLARL